MGTRESIPDPLRLRLNGPAAVHDATAAARIPLGDWATPDQIGQATLLLATPAAAYITGQTVYVDGGLKLTL